MDFNPFDAEWHYYQGCLSLLLILTVTFGFAIFQKILIHEILRSDHRGYFRFITKYRVTEESPYRHVSPLCEQVVRRAEATNRKNGHENLGCLSLEAAFSPRQTPLEALPESHAYWDRIVADLPALIQTQSLRDTINRMPLLSAGKECLDDRYLHRAASVLGILSHAYVRLDGDASLITKYTSHTEILPASLYTPWSQVCERLGRASTLLSFADLILHSFSTTADTVENMTLENSKLLIPTVNNCEEHTFYGTMIEMNAKTVPVMREIIAAQSSVLSEDCEGLKKNIRRLTILIRVIMKVTIAKISMNESRNTCMNPILWTKTVANLAVPWLDGVIGPAGTAHPFFHMMDEFTDRLQYDTRIGAEALRIRADYPVHWQQFLAAVRETSVANYVADVNEPELCQLWQALNNIYSGEEGLLGYHRRKVYGFLSVSFRVGRDSTINGLGRRQECRKWQEVDDELEVARRERNETKCCTTTTITRATDSDDALTTYAVHELIQHNNIKAGFWFSAHDYIYDASLFLSSHPGGQHTILLVSGQDATSDLTAVSHLSNPRIRATLERYRIGSVRRQQFASPTLQNLYDTVVQLGFMLAEAENVYTVTVQFLERPLTSADHAGDLNALRLRHFTESSVRLRDKQRPSLALLLQRIQGLLCQISGPDTVHKCDGTDFQRDTDVKSSGDAELTSIVTRAVMTAIIEHNCQVLAGTKAICVRMLKTIEDLPSDLSSAENLCESLADDVNKALRSIDRLGR